LGSSWPCQSRANGSWASFHSGTSVAPQQAQALGAGLGVDAYRGIERMATAMFPLRHYLRVIDRQPAAMHHVLKAKLLP